MGNPFDQFDPAPANPFDQFDPALSTAAPGVLTDDGTVWPADHEPVAPVSPAPSSPGLFSALGQFLAPSGAAVESAWNGGPSLAAPLAQWWNSTPSQWEPMSVPGIVGAIGSGAKDAATLPHDVAAGNVDMNDPAQAAQIAGRVANAALLASPVSPGSIGSTIARDAAPSAEALLQTGGNGFDAWRASGVESPVQPVADWAAQFQQGLLRDGIKNLPAGAPSTHAILDELASPVPGAVPFNAGDLDAIRKSFGKTAQGAGANNTERLAADRAENSFLDFLSRDHDPGVVDPSNEDAAAILRNAIGNWGAGKRSVLINNLDTNAELQEMRAHSGHAGSNPIRQNVASAIRLNPATGESLASRFGLDKPEIGALKNVVAGDRASNAIRTASNLMGGGLGHAGAIGGILGAKEGYEAGGVPGLIVGGSLPFVGTGLRKVDQYLASRRLADADNLVRLRSPLAQETGANIPTAPVFPTAQSRLVKALLLSQTPQNQ